MRSIKVLTAIQWICFMLTSGLLVYLLLPEETEPYCNIRYAEREIRVLDGGNAEGFEDKLTEDIEKDIKRMEKLPLFNQYDFSPDKFTKDPKKPPLVLNVPTILPYYSPLIIDDGNKVCTVPEPSTLLLMIIGVIYGIFFTSRRQKTTRNQSRK